MSFTLKIKLDKRFILGFLGLGIVVLFGFGFLLGAKLKAKSQREIGRQKEYRFLSKNSSPRGDVRRWVSFNYSPDLDLIEPTETTRLRLKPQGEVVEESYYISLDEPGQSLGEGIRIDKTGKPVRFGENRYTEHHVYYDPENRLVMVIYDPQPPLELGDIFVSWWDESRKTEAFDRLEVVLRTLKSED